MKKISRTGMIAGLLFFVTLSAQEYPGFRVIGRYLYDPCGEKVILRGVANPNIWFQKDGLPQYEEIEKTGANVIRIVWSTSGTADELRMAVENCIDYEMIPMVELHDATGNWSLLDEMVDYWISQDILYVIEDYEEYLLVNIANECGDYFVSNETFRTDYEAHINTMRDAGIHVPLVIDGTDWGKNIDILQSEGPSLIEADPDHNLLFSVHMWWPAKYGYSESDIVNEIAESVNMELPLIVGEFGHMHDDENVTEVTAANSIPYLTILEQCQLNEVGYIAWSWFGNSNPLYDMSSDGTYEGLNGWGLEVAVTDENSIANTSVRPYFIENGNCNASLEDSNNPAVERDFALISGFPNPFNATVTIQYSVNEPGMVRLDILNTRGQIVQTLSRGWKTAGQYMTRWDSRDHSGTEMPSGTYFCRMTTKQGGERRQQMIKLLLLK